MARKSDAVAGALARIKKAKVDGVNFRFTDLMGTWHQVTLPVSNVSASTFADGVGFDGSSVKGFTHMRSGDLSLIPDPDASYLDEFGGVRNMTFICYIAEANTKDYFGRDPRHVSEKALAYLKKTGIADQVRLIPELEFNLFDSVTLIGPPHGHGYFVESMEAGFGPDTIEKELPHIGSRSGYHTVPPVDTFMKVRARMVQEIERAGIPVKYSHHEVGSAGQCEVELKWVDFADGGDHVMLARYIIKNIAAEHGLVATFIPKILREQPGNGLHVHQCLWKKGKNLFFKKGGYGNLSNLGLNYIGGILKHGKALLALACPSTNSYRRLVPGYEAPTCFFFSIGNRSAAIRIPMDIMRAEQARIEYRPSDATSNIYLSLSAVLMAGIDGIKNGIDPVKAGYGPLDVDITDLDEIEARGIEPVPYSLPEALEALKADHDFLLEGGVFSEDIISAWIDAKYKSEILPISRLPHPHEIELYLDC
jgi:glutamine synthetase